MHRSSLRRFGGDRLHTSATPLTTSQLKDLINTYVLNTRTEITREELRQLLDLIVDTLVTVIVSGGNYTQVAVTAPSGSFAIGSNVAIDIIIIQSTTTQNVALGTTPGGMDIRPSLPVTAGVDTEVLTLVWFGAAGGTVYVTCSNDLTIKYFRR